MSGIAPPVITVAWENDIPDAVEALLDYLHPRCIYGINGQDVLVLERDGRDLTVVAWSDGAGGFAGEGPTGEPFVVPFEQLTSLVFY